MFDFSTLECFFNQRFPFLNDFFNESFKKENWLDSIDYDADVYVKLRQDLTMQIDASFLTIILDSDKRKQIYNDLIFAFYLMPYKYYIAAVYYTEARFFSDVDMSFVRDIYVLAKYYQNNTLELKFSDYYTKEEFLIACHIAAYRLEHFLSFFSLLRIYRKIN